MLVEKLVIRRPQVKILRLTPPKKTQAAATPPIVFFRVTRKEFSLWLYRFKTKVLRLPKSV